MQENSAQRGCEYIERCEYIEIWSGTCRKIIFKRLQLHDYQFLVQAFDPLRPQLLFRMFFLGPYDSSHYD